MRKHAQNVLRGQILWGRGAAPGEVCERSELLCASCGSPAVKLIDLGQSRNMGPPKHSQEPTGNPLAKVDAWAIRLVVLLQGIAVIAAILAGNSIDDARAILEGFLKVLELVARDV